VAINEWIAAQGLVITTPSSAEYISMIIAKSNGDLNIWQIIAVCLLSDFKHRVLLKLIEEFDKPEYDSFCPGSEELRKFLKVKATKAPWKYHPK
jgi:hypothetical protein